MRSQYPRPPALLAGLLLAALGLHFALTLAYLMPLNPIKLHLAPLLEHYIQPFFAQDWRFFAPEPISDTRILFLSCRLRQPDGTALETGWADVTTPWWGAQAQQRFSAAAWLSRPQAYAAQLYFNHSNLLIQLAHHKSTPDSALNHLAAEVEKTESERRVLATGMLARLGAAYCERWYGDRTTATRFCLAVLRFPRFSERQLPDSAGTLRYYPLDWLPYERVAPLMIAGE